MNKIIITNAHAHGFAFACDTETQGQVFIPVHIAEGFDLAPGDEIEAVLVPNYQDKSDKGTPWQAVKLQRPLEIVQITSKEHLTEWWEGISETPDEKVCEKVSLDKSQTLNQEALDADIANFIISAGGYHTTAEIADYFEINHKTAGNAAQRLFNSGKIAKADVFNRVGQQRPTIILWAASAKTFIEVV
jgi:bifunctional DNA-binding transcriptional regulator/antitoxin component of YhaV-PrlF toxin-antitoxin module